MGKGMVLRPPEVKRSDTQSPRPQECVHREMEEARRIRVTVLLAEDPFPARSGRAVRAVALARGFRRAGLEVSFEVVNAEGDGLRIEDGFRVFATASPPPWRNPISLYEPFNPPTAIARLADDPPDLALVTDSRAAPAALLLGTLGVRVVVDLPTIVEDVMRLTGAPAPELLAIKPVERLVAREPEGIIVASARDRDVIVKRHAAHPGRVVVFPTPASAPPVEPFSELGDSVVWIGRATGRVNRQALRRLTRSIIPQMRRLRPGTHVILAGHGTSAYANDPHIEAIEDVECLDTLLSRARCLVAPLSCGTGGRAKVVDALSRGVPVVCTPDAAIGHADLEGYGLLVGESDEQIADRILDLFEEPTLANELGDSGAHSYRQRRRENLLMEPVSDLVERARRAWLDPAQKLARLRDLRGRWPGEPEAVRDFLEQRPHRWGRLGSGLWGGD